MAQHLGLKAMQARRQRCPAILNLLISCQPTIDGLSQQIRERQLRVLSPPTVCDIFNDEHTQSETLTNSLVHRGAQTFSTPILDGLGITLAWFVALRFFVGFFCLLPFSLGYLHAHMLTLILSAWAGYWLLIRPNQVAPYPSSFADLAQRAVE